LLNYTQYFDIDYHLKHDIVIIYTYNMHIYNNIIKFARNKKYESN